MSKSNIAGVDEAGRGPLAGPVVAAAVILPPDHTIIGLADSKTMSEKKRERLYFDITQGSIAWAVSVMDAHIIDQINILQATLRAMREAVMQLSTRPSVVWVDGCHCPDVPMPCQAIVKGDQTVAVISAASIVAKVTRDRIMRAYDSCFVDYGFAQHKGYGTKQHLKALAAHGPCSIHRRSFRPVADAYQGQVEVIESLVAEKE